MEAQPGGDSDMDWAEVAQKLGFTGSTEGKWSVLGLTWTHIEPQGRLHAPAGAHARSAATCHNHTEQEASDHGRNVG